MRGAIVVALLLVAFAAAQNTPVQLWSTKTPLVSQFGDPAIDNGLLFMGAETATGNFVVAIDQQTGEQRWQSNFAGGGLYVAVGSGLVFHTTQHGLYALNQNTGAMVWMFARNSSVLPVNPLASGGWTGKPTYCGGRVYVTWYNTPMAAFDALTGKLLFVSHYTVGSRIFATSDGSWLTFFTISTSGMYALTRVTAGDGKIVWAQNYSSAYNSLVASDYGIVTLSFPIAAPTVQLALGVQPADGTFLWSMSAIDSTAANTNFDYNVQDDIAYTVYQNTFSTTQLLARNIVTGAVLWKVDIQSQDNSINLAAFPSAVVVVALNTGYTWAFDARTGTPLFLESASAPYYGIADVASNAYYFGNGNNFITAVQLRGN